MRRKKESNPELIAFLYYSLFTALLILFVLIVTLFLRPRIPLAGSFLLIGGLVKRSPILLQPGPGEASRRFLKAEP